MKLKHPLPQSLTAVCATFCNTGGMNIVDVRGPRFVPEKNIRCCYVIYSPHCPCAFDLLCLAHSSHAISEHYHFATAFFYLFAAFQAIWSSTVPDIIPRQHTKCPRGKAGGLQAQLLCHNKHHKRGEIKDSSSSKSLTIVSAQVNTSHIIF